MNSHKVHFVIDLTIQQGKFEDFAGTVRQMIGGTAKESGALCYEWYLSSDNCRCRLLETYANAEAAGKHMSGAVVKELVPKLLTVAKLERFEVYGTPDEPSAAALKAVGAEIFGHWQGLPSHVGI